MKTESGIKKLGIADAKGIAEYFGLKKGEWEKQPNGTWKWKDADGVYSKSTWELINEKWYYFGSNGIMLTGWQEIGGKYYYLSKPNGDMKTGWLKMDDEWYYLSSNGARVSNSWKWICLLYTSRQATKEVLVYDVVNGEEMKEEAITYIVDKDEKTAKMKKSGDSEKTIDTTDEILSIGDIDLTYVTDYEVLGEEEMDGRKMIAVKMTEEGYLTAAEVADNEMGDKLQGLLEDSEALRQAYDECLAEQMREKYVWFDAQTKDCLLYTSRCV